MVIACLDPIVHQAGQLPVGCTEYGIAANQVLTQPLMSLLLQACLLCSLSSAHSSTSPRSTRRLARTAAGAHATPAPSTQAQCIRAQRLCHSMQHLVGSSRLDMFPPMVRWPCMSPGSARSMAVSMSLWLGPMDCPSTSQAEPVLAPCSRTELPLCIAEVLVVRISRRGVLPGWHIHPEFGGITTMVCPCGLIFVGVWLQCCRACLGGGTCILTLPGLAACAHPGVCLHEPVHA